jgi:hypothetical protein
MRPCLAELGSAWAERNSRQTIRGIFGLESIALHYPMPHLPENRPNKSISGRVDVAACPFLTIHKTSYLGLKKPARFRRMLQRLDKGT